MKRSLDRGILKKLIVIADPVVYFQIDLGSRENSRERGAKGKKCISGLIGEVADGVCWLEIWLMEHVYGCIDHSGGILNLRQRSQ